MTASPPPRIAPDELAGRLPAPERLLVLVDFDGTLSEIVPEPDAARPVDGAVAALAALADRCPVAIVSGRPVADLRRRLDPDLPVTLAGGHGAEVATPDGRERALSDPAAVATTLDRLEADLADLVDPAAGWVLERKPTSLAVHHRKVADPEPTLAAVRDRMRRDLDAPPGFALLDGKAVTELRPAGVDKGGVVDHLVAEHPDRHVLVVGDDVTDEDAFAAAIARGGTAVLVADTPRPSRAIWRLRDPREVVTLLSHLAGPDLSHSP
jgi:trehalose 6-phosphate phosphatase